jgi:NAD dependent epimerase/dehydratase family enzyme
MNVLVTGATGLIGRRLCPTLVEAGHRVFAVSCRPDAARQQLPWLAGAFVWEGANAQFPSEAIRGVDAIVHLAGETVSGRWTSERRRAIRESRVRGTAALVNAIARPPGAPGGRAAVETRPPGMPGATLGPLPHALICASAIGYYGHRGEEQLAEDSPPGAGFLAGVCRDWEAEALRAEGLGLRVVRLRTGIVLDPGGGALVSMLPLFRTGLGGPMGSGKQWWSWIDSRDLVALIQHALEHEVRGALNGVSPEPVRQRDFARALGRALHRSALLPTPAFALRAALGGFAEELLASRRIEPRAALGCGFTFHWPRLEPALADIVGAV